MKTIYIDFTDGSTATATYSGSNVQQIRALTKGTGKEPIRADVYTHVGSSTLHNGRYIAKDGNLVKEA